VIEINGSSFGTVGDVFIGGKTCELAAIRTHTSIRCRLPPGEGLNKVCSSNLIALPAVSPLPLFFVS